MDEERRWLHQGGECGKQWDELPISVSYFDDVSCWHLEALFRDPTSVSYFNDVSCWHLLRLRQGGENVADVSGNGAAFPDVLATKGRNHDGDTEENYFPSSLNELVDEDDASAGRRWVAVSYLASHLARTSVAMEIR